MTTLALVGWSALVAAVATVVGAVTLGLFFSKGQPWGTINDVASIVLMLATIPVALGIADVSSSWVALPYGVALLGIAGMVGASVSQGLLVARLGSYERLLPWTLAFGAVVGAWYLLIGLGGIGSPSFRLGPGSLVSLETLAILSGLGFILVGIGFWRGGQQSRLATVAGIVLLVSSTWFLGWAGLEFLSGEIAAA